MKTTGDGGDEAGSTNWRLTAIVLMVASVIGLATAIWIAPSAPGSGALDGSGQALIGGPFTLVDGDGAPVTEAVLSKPVNFVYFGFTHCPDFCPTELANLAEAKRALAERGVESRIIFITVDPARDTPAVVGEYARYFDSEAIGLTGSAEQVAEAASRFRVYYQLGEPDLEGDYAVDHSTVVYAMDADGRFIRHFSYGTPPDAIADALAAAQ